MLVRDTGEFQLIEMLANTIAERNRAQVDSLTQRGFRLRLSIGDDAAAWEAPSGTTVLTTDTLVEGVHFDLRHIGWRDLGWKTLAVSLSDVAAMGCLPTFSTVTLGLRGDLPVDGLVEMYRGMQDACRRYGGVIVGGDVVRSPVFFATVAIEGMAEVGVDGLPPKLLTRDAASPGDRIAVTGHLGCSAGGLRMMTQRLRFDEATSRHLTDAHNRPEPRVAEGAALARAGANAAIDVSDGVLDDLRKLCKASGVDAVVQSHLV
ncbi:MAG: thiamine-phosphate kinase, partial [Chloroflexi bacterium]|nr:thiamine-phosphate kinase [Chloroflexota bacterium]